MNTHKFPRTALAFLTFCVAASAWAGEEVIDNPYGLSALWAQGDIVAKGTLMILVLMSMGSWYVIITKLLEQSRVLRLAKAAQDSFWSAGSVRQGADSLEAQSPFRYIAEKGLEGGYNWLVRRNKSAMEEVNAFGADLHAVLLGSAKK